jgi:Short C-terminal domain
MGLIRGMARTAVVAGTATAVSNRVSRRQANRWAEKDQQQADADAYEQQQAAPPQQAYAPPPPPPEPAAPAQADVLSQLQQLGELKAAGVLTEEEFAAQKAKILGS